MFLKTSFYTIFIFILNFKLLHQQFKTLEINRIVKFKKQYSFLTSNNFRKTFYKMDGHNKKIPFEIFKPFWSRTSISFPFSKIFLRHLLISPMPLFLKLIMWNLSAFIGFKTDYVSNHRLFIRYILWLIWTLSIELDPSNLNCWASSAIVKVANRKLKIISVRSSVYLFVKFFSASKLFHSWSLINFRSLHSMESGWKLLLCSST